MNKSYLRHYALVCETDMTVTLRVFRPDCADLTGWICWVIGSPERPIDLTTRPSHGPPKIEYNFIGIFSANVFALKSWMVWKRTHSHYELRSETNLEIQKKSFQWTSDVKSRCSALQVKPIKQTLKTCANKLLGSQQLYESRVRTASLGWIELVQKKKRKNVRGSLGNCPSGSPSDLQL